MPINVPRRTASVRDLGKTKKAPSNCIRYTCDGLRNTSYTRITIAGVEFGRNLGKIFDDPDDIRTIIFPTAVRIVRQGSFCEIQSLRVAVLNKGLEVLSTDECPVDDWRWYGVFSNSGI